MTLCITPALLLCGVLCIIKMFSDERLPQTSFPNSGPAPLINAALKDEVSRG